jgi:hypothetical protein
VARAFDSSEDPAMFWKHLTKVITTCEAFK